MAVGPSPTVSSAPGVSSVIAAPVSPDEKRDMFAGTARRVYLTA